MGIMTVFVVSYDLNNPGQNYDDLYKAIRSIGSWWHYLDSTWLVSTNLTAKNIYDRLSPHLDSNDRILIIEAGKNWHARINDQAYQWIRLHL